MCGNCGNCGCSRDMYFELQEEKLAKWNFPTSESKKDYTLKQPYVMNLKDVEMPCGLVKEDSKSNG